MDKFPGNDPNWLAALNSDDDDNTAPMAGNPYHPIHLGDTSEEEDPSEDEADPIYNEQNDNEGILVDVPIAEGILEDAQTDGELEESLTDEEAATPPSSPVVPHFEPYLLGGKGPTMRRTPRISIRTQPDTYSLLDGTVCGHGRISDMPRTLPDITPFLTQPTCGHKRKALDSHYEIGESSRAPPPVAEYTPAPPPTVDYSPVPPPAVESSPAPPPDGESSQAPPPVDESPQALSSLVTALQEQIVRMDNRIRSLEMHNRTTSTTTVQRVERLEEQGRTDGSAIQTLYHRVGAGRTEAISIGTRLQTSAYETQILRTRLTLAERQAADLRYELNQLREQFDEVVRYLTDRG